jgi:hypothetical protein
MWNSLDAVESFPQALLTMSTKFFCVVLAALFTVQVSTT